MAVNLFKISGLSGTNGTKFYYRSDGYFYADETGGTSLAGTAIGLSVDMNSLNPDGTRTVTVNKAAFGSGALSQATPISITDLKSYDRQGFRLALDTTSLSAVDCYGGAQSLSINTTDMGATLSLSGINDGLLVSANGQSINWATKSASTASIVITGATNGTSSNISVVGKTIIFGTSAMASGGTAKIASKTNADDYTFLLSSSDANVSQYKSAGWSMAEGDKTTASFYTAIQTAGYKVSDDGTKIVNASVSAETEYFKLSGLSNIDNAAGLTEYFTISKLEASNSQAEATVKINQAGVSALLSDYTDKLGKTRTLTLTDSTTNYGT